MTAVFLLLLVWYSIGCAVLTAKVAESKGRSPIWAVAGFFFGIAGLLGVGLMENIRDEDEIRTYAIKKRDAWERSLRP